MSTSGWYSVCTVGSERTTRPVGRTPSLTRSLTLVRSSQRNLLSNPSDSADIPSAVFPVKLLLLIWCTCVTVAPHDEAPTIYIARFFHLIVTQLALRIAMAFDKERRG